MTRWWLFLGSVVAIAACVSRSEPVCDDTEGVFVNDARPTDACEVLITHGSRSLRIEVPGAGTCTSAGCDLACQSPDLALSFAYCSRGGGTLAFQWTPQSKAAVRDWFGAARGDTATVTVTCGGVVVASDKLWLCVVAA